MVYLQGNVEIGYIVWKAACASQYPLEYLQNVLIGEYTHM